ncbi:hypothetical protein SAMN02745126_04993 [Enhydrobacter aerosaccus]|uniref:Uncharacterized protein n=1 Tax=Enhydrobacter aerosaccus TaxID=225324 RepID=A0A1T4SQQ2_9HYPH|nr:hypothetical protein [Enhydrobacter aerosaccus]SKA30594.1 hypothetical protein SAMN02745126_04993 [Enhydrobacter aerosaccus]
MNEPRNELLKKIAGTALGVAGFAARVTISFFVILWAYALVTIAFDGLLAMSWAKFLADPLIPVAIAIIVGAVMPYLLFFNVVCMVVDPSLESCFPELVPTWAYLCAGLAAIPVAIIWGRICLRRCGPASEWF